MSYDSDFVPLDGAVTSPEIIPAVPREGLIEILNGLNEAIFDAVGSVDPYDRGDIFSGNSL